MQPARNTCFSLSGCQGQEKPCHTSHRLWVSVGLPASGQGLFPGRELGNVQSVGNVGKPKLALAGFLTPSVEYHAEKRRTKCGRSTALSQGQDWGLPNASGTCSIIGSVRVGSRGQVVGCTG